MDPVDQIYRDWVESLVDDPAEREAIYSRARTRAKENRRRERLDKPNLIERFFFPLLRRQGNVDTSYELALRRGTHDVLTPRQAAGCRRHVCHACGRSEPKPMQIIMKGGFMGRFVWRQCVLCMRYSFSRWG